MIPLTWGTQNRQIHKHGKQSRGYQGQKGELLFNGYIVAVWGKEKALEIDSGDSCTLQMYLIDVTELYI